MGLICLTNGRGKTSLPALCQRLFTCRFVFPWVQLHPRPQAICYRGITACITITPLHHFHFRSMCMAGFVWPKMPKISWEGKGDDTFCWKPCFFLVFFVVSWFFFTTETCCGKQNISPGHISVSNIPHLMVSSVSCPTSFTSQRGSPSLLQREIRQPCCLPICSQHTHESIHSPAHTQAKTHMDLGIPVGKTVGGLCGGFGR